MNLKSFLWRCLYAAIFVIVLVVCVPLIFAMVGVGIPAGPAFTLIKFAGACLVILYCFFGPEPPALF